MNRILLNLAICSIIFFSFACNEKNKTGDNRISLLNEFKNPPAEYRSMPLWVWNDRVTKQEIEEQMADFKNKGMGGVFVHPRPGLITPYLSPEWFELFSYAVEVGKKIGIQVWIYDENSYPSGFAGGHVPAEMPESEPKMIKLIITTQPDTIKQKNIKIFEKNDSVFTDVTTQSKFEKGEYYVYLIKYADPSPWCAGYTYVDIMQEKNTQKFIDVTYKKGYDQFKSEYGKGIQGTFMDESNIKTDWSGKYLNYSDALFQTFKQRNGYSLEDNLYKLSVETGNYRKVRFDFYATLNYMLIEGWAKPYHEFCKQNNLILTGHYWDHDWPIPNAVPDNMAVSAYSDYPGIDLLMNNWFQGYSGQFGNSRMVKEVSSVSNQLGKKRNLSETYGAAGWDISFTDQKRIADWEYALGINFMNQHLSYITIAGARKRDHPQSFSYHEPWWDNYKYLADYFGRLSVAMSKGEQINKTLLLEPTTSAWMNYTPDWDPHWEVENAWKNEKIGTLLASFHELINKFEMWQVEYDLGCEDIIKNHGSAVNSEFTIGNRAYNLVILPENTENLISSTVDILEKYLEQGGIVLSYCGTPEYLDGEKSNRMKLLADKYSKQFIISNNPDKNEIFGFSKPDIRFEIFGAERFVFHQTRKLSDAQMLFITNVHDTLTSKVKICVAAGSVEQWDLFTGETKNISYTSIGDSVLLETELPAASSLLLCFTSEKKVGIAHTNIVFKPVQFTDSLTISRLHPNVLTIDFCDYTVKNIQKKDEYFYSAQTEIYKQHGFSKNVWDNTVQFKSEYLDRDTFGAGSGFEATYKLWIDKGTDTKQLQVVVERAELYTVSVNGTELKQIPNQWWLDKAFGVFDISDVVKTGENQITIKNSPFKLLAELEAVYILGNFSLESQKLGFKLVPAKPMQLKSWKKQGMPFYSHGVAYNHIIKASTTKNNYKLKLNNWKGSISEIYVNDKKVAVSFLPPFETDISNFLKEGDNNVKVVVIGTLKNLLGPHHQKSSGSAWPAMWFNFEKGRTLAGDSYIFDNYGLEQDFVVLESLK